MCVHKQMHSVELARKNFKQQQKCMTIQNMASTHNLVCGSLLIISTQKDFPRNAKNIGQGNINQTFLDK